MTPSNKLLNRGFIAVVIAQFFSALADNALFFTLLSYFNENRSHYPTYSIYILQSMFIIAYIMLAPVVGSIADKYPKGRVLLIGNGLKLIGVLFLFLNVSPYICYALVGIGAAVYSPAKFGILGELVTNRLLVKANGMIEGSTIIAILAGSMLGGSIAQYNFLLAVAIVVLTYTVAVISNVFIPKMVPQKQNSSPLLEVFKDFVIMLKQLFWDGRARLAILGTSLFWGAATTLRLLLNDWVNVVLGKGAEMVAVLNGIVGIGIVFGAAFAAFFINTKQINRCLWFGFAMGVVLMIFPFQSNTYLTCFLLVLTGALGGAFIIPLNSLLQERGQHFRGTGKAVAAQNFSENSVMLSMMAFFGLFTLLKIPPSLLMAGFGLLFSLSIAGLAYHMHKRKIMQ